jgi:outer membrane receptor protein involved in Fe transport
MSIISSETIAASPGQSYGDLLRPVPGLNVIQMSAREIDVSSRQATSTLANTQLAVLDGRSIYADFFGLVFWDLLPVNTSDVKQIEVVRGPASAIWGANAATGVVNIITKSPREAPGGTLILTAGGFSRDAGDTNGQGVGELFSANVSFARAPSDRWAYRVSAGFFDSDPFPRPLGTIPLQTHPLDNTIVVGGGNYQDPSAVFVNRGTKQPKLDLRVDEELAGGGQLDYSGGIAASQGIIHTPIGPFDLQKNSYFGYGRIGYAKGSLRITAFANFLDGDAPNLISRDASGQLLVVNFKTQTYDLELGDSHLLGERHLLTYGGNLRRNNFNISIAPKAQDRTEAGAFLQDEILLDKFRLALSGRVDKFGNLSSAFFSPRAAVIFKPTPTQSLRASFNRAFRAPTAIDNYLDVSVLGGEFPLGAVNPALAGQFFPIVVHNVGNPNLKAETHKAYEVGYTGIFANKTTLGLAFYINDTDNTISNTTTAAALLQAGIQPFYTSANPPPGWPLDPALIDILAAQGVVRFPAEFATLNVGGLRNKGFEASVDHAFFPWLNGFANYSYQAAPEPTDPVGDPRRIATDGISVPPKNRFNAGLNLNHKRYLGSVSLNHADQAFWADVLNDPFHGFTPAYTLWNASLGVRWGGGRVTTILKGTNLLNDNIQQHIFGDILKRSLAAEVRLAF